MFQDFHLNVSSSLGASAEHRRAADSNSMRAVSWVFDINGVDVVVERLEDASVLVRRHYERVALLLQDCLSTLNSRIDKRYDLETTAKLTVDREGRTGTISSR